MRHYNIQFDILHITGALLVLLAVLAAAWAVGYAKGTRQAERQFCDKFILDDPTPPQP